MSSHITQASELIDWIVSNGGYFHPSAKLRIDESTGLSVFADDTIHPEEKLVSCPFSLAVTSELATQAVCEITGIEEGQLIWPKDLGKEDEPWNERMRIGAYLGLHWVYQERPDAEWPRSLVHKTYLASLPSASNLPTPLYFTESELQLLSGSNLLGAVEDRRAEWSAESKALRTILKEDGLTWERYLATSTYMSSRAFPSKLLDLPPDGEMVPQSTRIDPVSKPVLLPGVDIFNHARGQPILWLSSMVSTPNAPQGVPSISLVSSSVCEAGSQLFNNYGAKPNEELLLGYGFVLNSNPDDIVNLRLGTASLPEHINEKLQSKGLDARERFELRRNGEVDKRLLEIMRVLLGGGNEENELDDDDEHALHEKEEREMQLELDVLGMLGGMLEDKLEKLRTGSKIEVVDARAEVRRMCAVYRQGQMDILNAALDKLSDRIERIEGLMDEGMGGCPCCS
ncbi:cytoplasmic protein [Cryptococcus deuterogattii 99/473]|uniref:Cytoplasmic protein n=2 Tax=Cryptococcus deuterogattii TaxID=1859096 RepID=A0A0D0VAK4_9TREE|nr:cytoplasmic protein [Cryptococcus deuterogattii R265]KIR43454.1 cytoplasmic protein [Cryptococcus deuterogattii Ram5]KIR74787.1 cytoplasmic protein [Cryptococcus deuterogattii CA1014]KIY57130.1 cytoplasmic protein [Cryptococcus deuterogattii 99/473]